MVPNILRKQEQEEEAIESRVLSEKKEKDLQKDVWTKINIDLLSRQK